MPIITSITATRHPARFDLLVEGERIATLSLEALERLRLAVGGSVTGLEDRIAHEAARLKTYDRALAMLAARGRSAAELTRSLLKKGEQKEMVDVAIARLQDQGLVDDAAFAQAFTRAKVLGSQQSKRRVQQALVRKGVNRAIADTAIAVVLEDEQVDQRAVVEGVARRKLRSMRKLDPAVRRRRLYAFLARRGYDGEDIRQAMEVVGPEIRDGETAEE